MDVRVKCKMVQYWETWFRLDQLLWYGVFEDKHSFVLPLPLSGDMVHAAKEKGKICVLREASRFMQLRHAIWTHNRNLVARRERKYHVSGSRPRVRLLGRIKGSVVKVRGCQENRPDPRFEGYLSRLSSLQQHLRVFIWTPTKSKHLYLSPASLPSLSLLQSLPDHAAKDFSRQHVVSV